MSVGSLGLIASQNGIHFKKYAEKLLDSGAVYRCFCSNEVLFSPCVICMILCFIKCSWFPQSQLNM